MTGMRGSSWVLMVVLGLLVVVARGQVSGSQCKEEQRLLINFCLPVLIGRDPSPACCGRVRAIHFECVCPVLTPKLAARINVPKRIKQIEACGRRVPRNFKCGSITTPHEESGTCWDCYFCYT